MRFYMLDRIEEMVLGERIRAIKCWTLTDEIFNDHFPGFPIVPGVLQVESLAQALGMLAEKSYPKSLARPGSTSDVYALMSILHKVKFKRFVLPGDRMIVEAGLSSIDAHSATGSARAIVDGEVRTTAEISFSLVPKEAIPSQHLDQQRNQYYDVLRQKEWLDSVAKQRPTS